MADNSKTISKEIEDVLKRLERTQKSQEQSSYKLSQAMDGLSNTALDKLTETIKQGAKQLGILNDEQLDLIKTSRDLTDVLAAQEKKVDAAADALKEYEKAIKEANKASTNETRASKNAIKIAETELEVKLAGIGISKEQAKQSIENRKRFAELTEKSVSSAKALNHFTKNVDDATDSLKSWIAKNLTAAEAARQIGKGLKQAYDQFTKLSSVGLQGTLYEVNKQAISMHMSFEEFSDVIAKNRNSINALGGGAEGIRNFTDKVKESSKDLAYLGKEGYAATARFTASLDKAGVSMKSDKFSQSMKVMTKQFKEFNGLYGDTYEQYSSLMEAQLTQESIQSKMIGLGKANVDAVVKEVAARTANFKAMLMSNEQIDSFNKKLETLYDPNKNKQAERQTAALNMKNYAAALMRQDPNSKLGSAEMQKKLEELTQVMQYGDDNEVKKFYAENSDLAKELSESRARVNQSALARGRAGDIGGAAFQNYEINDYDAKLGGHIDPMKMVGDSRAQAAVKGMDYLGEQRKDFEKLQESTAKVADAQDLVSESMKFVRDKYELLQAAMGSTLGVIAGGVALGLGSLAISSRAFGKALDFARGKLLTSSIGPSGVDTGPLSKGNMIKGLMKGGAGTILGLGAAYVGSELKDAGYEKTGTAVGIGGGALSGASTGAMIGSVIPGVGTLIGGALGGAAGAAYGVYKNWDTVKGMWSSKSDVDPSFSEPLPQVPQIPQQSNVAKSVNTNMSKKDRRSAIEQAAMASGMSGKELAAFMAQMDHESGGFKHMRELGNSSYFQKYEGRKDLGNNQAGDGEKFKGRGFIQLTGRANYKKYGDMIGQDLVNNPELAEDPTIAAQIALAYWNDKKIGGKTLAEQAKTGNFDAVTKGINGGFNGKADRDLKYAMYSQQYGDAGPMLASNTVTGGSVKPAVLNKPYEGLDQNQNRVAAAPTGNPALDELKVHTSLLSQIAQNTTQSYKPEVNHRNFKRPATEVVT